MFEKSTYSVICDCSNCGFSSPVDFPYGVHVNASLVKCPNCGCKSLTKSEMPFKDYKDYSKDMCPWGKRLPILAVPHDTPIPPAHPHHRPGEVWCKQGKSDVHPGIMGQLFELSLKNLVSNSHSY